MTTKKILDYFTEEVEYPSSIFENPIPMGVYWEMISTTFLNGFVNYGKPIGCWVTHRYTSKEQMIDAHVTDSGQKNWHKWHGKKSELIELLNSGKKRVYHFNLRSFEDDVLLLLKSEHEDDVYLFMWFDIDTSDCSIGKFRTTDTKDDVIQSVRNFLDHETKNKLGVFEDGIDNGVQMYDEMNLAILGGWIKF